MVSGNHTSSSLFLCICSLFFRWWFCRAWWNHQTQLRQEIDPGLPLDFPTLSIAFIDQWFTVPKERPIYFLSFHSGGCRHSWFEDIEPPWQNKVQRLCGNALFDLHSISVRSLELEWGRQSKQLLIRIRERMEARSEKSKTITFECILSFIWVLVYNIGRFQSCARCFGLCQVWRNHSDDQIFSCFLFSFAHLLLTYFM